MANFKLTLRRTQIPTIRKNQKIKKNIPNFQNNYKTFIISLNKEGKRVVKRHSDPVLA